MRSEATSVEQYLAELPVDRREAIQAVRDTILANLPPGYEEAQNFGMITYQVPLESCPNTYNGQPLMYAALASQKNHMAVYLSAIYADGKRRARFEEAYRSSGKKLNAGKSCVRFKKLEDLPLPLIGETIASIPAPEFVELYSRARSGKK